MDLGLTNKRALVLAASGGLGRGIARALALEGARVAICSRRADVIAEAARAIAEESGSEVTGHVCDLADRASVDAMLAAVAAQFGAVDVLVNNSGGPPPGPVDEIADGTWREWFETMLVSLIHVTNRWLPAMKEQNWGRVLTIGSSSVISPLPNMVVSTALRASVAGWNKTLATEVAAYGITCNLLLPGRIQTPRVDEVNAATAQRMGTPLEAFVRDTQAKIPAGRYGQVEEFADVAAFLASTRASYVTGSLIRLDGGAIEAI